MAFGKIMKAIGKCTMKLNRELQMKILKTIGLLLLTTALITIASSCKWEVPTEPFDALINSEVIAPLAYMDSGINSQNSITLNATFPVEIKETIVSYKWEIQDIFGETILESSEESFSINSFNAEEYKVVLTITNKDGYTRVFSKEFVVSNIAIDTEFTVTGINATDDTGNSDSDNITSKNDSITVYGTGPADTEVSFKLINTSLSFSKEFTTTTDTNGDATILLNNGGALVDEIYEIYLSKTADGEKSSYPLYLTIDTIAPILEWKNTELATSIKFSDSPHAWNMIIANEPIFDHKFNGTNYPTATENEGFDPFITGAQVLERTSYDRAGNLSDSIARTLTIESPILQPLLNPGFNEGTGGVGRDYDENKGIATGWELEVTVKCIYGILSNSSSIHTNIGEGPFRVDESPLNNYSYCTTSYNAEGDQTGDPGNYFWFSSNFNAGDDKRYGKVWGTVRQSNISVYKNVPYRFKAYTKNGDDHKPTPSSGLQIEGPSEMFFSTDFDTLVFDQEGSVIKNALASNEDWEEIIIDFVPNMSGSVDVILEKYDNSDPEEGNWSMFDETSLEIVTSKIPTVTP